MRLLDRRYLQANLIAWAAIYICLLVELFSAEKRQDLAELFVLALLVMALMAAIFTAVCVAIPLRIVLNLAIKERRQSHRSETLQWALLLAVIVGYFFEVQRERRSLAPPKGAATLADFARVMPAPRQLELIQKEGQDYILWMGRRAGPLDVPSGPSCYLFDQSGNLIGWQLETGDGGRIEDFVESAVKQREITVDEALDITRDRIKDALRPTSASLL